ncbi:AMP-binding protein [Sphingomonas sp. SUN039]|uniref:AMP-binding protein n=1 Tax=Sphingomonas sp. SUN039 TaxID=2937787 RepID=UPI002164DE39|nr:AMP-binding protein [Sphingomonas sp. SUN039]UVO54392.1 AMP-binding protein [Sphingomonas sp. SUN039]
MIDPVATHGRARAGRLALVDLDSGQRWRWAELDAACNRTAHWLIERLGAASGARVAVIGRNSAAHLILQFGCVRAGAIFVPLNWRLAVPEIAALIADAAPAIVLADAEFATDGVLDLATFETLVAGYPAAPPVAEARRAWEAASTLLYTSGTSGKPKGVMVSEANAHWGAVNFMLGNHVSCDSIFLCDMPLFHTAGLFANARTPILAGATLLVSRGFDPERTLARLADPALGVTHYFSVPQMAQTLWNAPGFAPEMLSRLQVYATGGAPNPAAQIARFVGAGIPMSDGFGMSETCSNFGMPVDDPEVLVAKAGSIGLPYVSVEARIVDDDGTDMADGATGELWLRGPTITSGYWNQPALTAAALTDGWFRTGDAARRDAEGYYFLVDRKKDMFISGGENVYPAEVEAAIAELADVAECAVIGLPDARWGEVGQAYVIAVAGRSVSDAEIIAHCKVRLAGFKVPKSVVVTDKIPRTASGKVQKHVLRAQASEGSGE